MSVFTLRFSKPFSFWRDRAFSVASNSRALSSCSSAPAAVRRNVQGNGGALLFELQHRRQVDNSLTFVCILGDRCHSARQISNSAVDDVGARPARDFSPIELYARAIVLVPQVSRLQG